MAIPTFKDLLQAVMAKRAEGNQTGTYNTGSYVGAPALVDTDSSMVGSRGITSYAANDYATQTPSVMPGEKEPWKKYARQPGANGQITMEFRQTDWFADPNNWEQDIDGNWKWAPKSNPFGMTEGFQTSDAVYPADVVGMDKSTMVPRDIERTRSNTDSMWKAFRGAPSPGGSAVSAGNQGLSTTEVSGAFPEPRRPERYRPLRQMYPGLY